MTEAAVVSTTPEDEFDAEFDKILAATASNKPAKKQADADEGAVLEDNGDEAAEKLAAEKAAAKAAAAVSESAATVGSAFFDDGPPGDDATQEEKDAYAANQKAATEAAEKAAKDAAAVRARVDEELAVRRALADDDAAKASAKEAALKAAKEAAESDIGQLIEKLEMPTMTAEQKRAWDVFAESNPEQAAAVMQQLDHQGKTLAVQFTKALATIVQKVNDTIGPLQKETDDLRFERHLTALVTAHTDYKELVAPTGADKKGASKIQAWIAKQPGFLQSAMNRVYSEGSTDEMLDLVGQFKQANGITAKPQVPGDETAGKGAKTKVSSETVAALKPVVGSKRTTPQTQGVDTNDFDGAFAEFTAAHEQETSKRR